MTYYNRITTCLAQNKLSVKGGWLDNNSDGSSADGGDSGSGSAASGGGASAGGLAVLQFARVQFSRFNQARPFPLANPVTPGSTIIIAGGYDITLTGISDSDLATYTMLYNVNVNGNNGTFIAYLNGAPGSPTSLIFNNNSQFVGDCYVFEVTPVSPQLSSPYSSETSASPTGSPFSFDMPAPVVAAKVLYLCSLNFDADVSTAPIPAFNNLLWSSESSSTGIYVSWFVGPSATQQSVTMIPRAAEDNLIFTAEGIFA